MLSFSAHRIGWLALTIAAASSSAASAGHVSRAKTQLSTHRIHVPGIGLDRQRVEPAADRVGALPRIMHQPLAFAQGRIVAEVAERAATGEAGLRDAALDRGKFERQRRDR